jgi:PAS domain S-box-containing protein
MFLPPAPAWIGVVARALLAASLGTIALVLLLRVRGIARHDARRGLLLVGCLLLAIALSQAITMYHISPYPSWLELLVTVTGAAIAVAVAFQVVPAVDWILKRLGSIEPASGLLAQEIVERQRAERGEAEHRRMMDGVLACLSDGVIVTDPAGRQVLWNPVAEQLLGLPSANLAPEDLAAYASVRQPADYTPIPTSSLPLVQAMRGRTVSGEEILLQPRGEVEQRWMSLSATPVVDRDGSRLGGVIVLRDISRAKELERQLRRHAAFLELLQEVTVAAADAESLHTAASATLRALCRRLRWQVGHLYGITEDRDGALEVLMSDVHYLADQERFGDFHRWLLAHQGASAVPVHEALSARRPTWFSSLPVDWDLTVAAGASRLASAVILPVMVKERPVAALVCYSEEQRAYDSQLADVLSQIGLQLSRMVERQRSMIERDQIRAQAEQAQKMDAIGRLAGGVAHDFNNLLTVILGEAQLALLAAAPDDRQLQESLDEVRRAGERAAVLTRQLLTFSRQRITARDRFSVNEMITDLERLLTRLIGEDIVLRAEPGAEHATVSADRGQLEQVVTNMVVNARDAMPRGGDVMVRTSNATWPDSRSGNGRVPGEYVVLTVADTGIGMTEEVRQKVFDAFFTTKAPGKGTGLGLATSLGIVEQCGGFIDVESGVGQGTRFHVYLPVVEAVEPIAEVRRPDSMPLGSETIVLVEDDAATRGVCERALSRLGYRVVPLGDPLEALDRLRSDPQTVDLLLTDLVMPSMNGLALARRARRIRPEMRVLYISGYSEEVIATKDVIEQGLTLLHKPFAMEDLAAAVRHCLDSPVVRSPLER